MTDLEKARNAEGKRRTRTEREQEAMELWAGVEVRKQKLVWLEGEVDRMRVHAVVRTSSSSCFAVLSMTSLLVPDTARRFPFRL